jgi:hypothetical protein
MTASSNGNSSSSSSVERPSKVAGIHYRLEDQQIAQHRAAGSFLGGWGIRTTAAAAGCWLMHFTLQQHCTVVI